MICATNNLTDERMCVRKGEDNEKEVERVKVFVRFRPCREGEYGTVNVVDKRKIHIPDDNGRIDRDRWYNYDHVFTSCTTNKLVFQKVGQPLVEASLNGFNSSLFAYGQTGSGKTHTLMSNDGMTLNMVNLLFSKIWADTLNEYKVTCSYLQIYQEKIYDLLDGSKTKELSIREDPVKGIFVENLSNYVINKPSDLHELLSAGTKRLVFAETRMNRLSSRSHAVCQLFIERKLKSNKQNGDSQEAPVEVSSPRLLQQIADICKPDLQPIPNIPSGLLRKRHSIAVSKPAKRNSVGHINMNRRTRNREMEYLTTGGPLGKFHSLPRNRSKLPTMQFIGSPKISQQNLDETTASRVSSCSLNSSNFLKPPQEEGLGRLNIRRCSIPEENTEPLGKRFSIPENLNLHRRCSIPESSDLRRRCSIPENSNIGRRCSIPENIEIGPSDMFFGLHQKLNLSSPSESSAEVFPESLSETHAVSFSDTRDSLIEDMEWQMDASTNDISKVFGFESTTNEGVLNESEIYEPVMTTPYYSENVLLKGKISIVDLAGSERLKKTQAEGERLHEAQNINSSLLELGNVVSALSDSSRTHIPYRNSTLTRLMQDSIGNNCKTNFLLCSSGAASDQFETKCTLDFGKRLMMIKSQSTVNMEVDFKGMCEELKRKLKESEKRQEKISEEFLEKIQTLQDRVLEKEENEKCQQLIIENLENENELHVRNRETSKLELTELEILNQEYKQKLKENEKEINELQNRLKLKTKSSVTTSDASTNTILNTSDSNYSSHLKHTCNKYTSPVHAFYKSSPIHKNFQSPLKSSPIRSRNNSLNWSSSNTQLNDRAYPNMSPLKKLSKEKPEQNSSPSGLENDTILSLKNILLAELMSMQLIYSMFDVSNPPENPDIKSDELEEKLEKTSESPVSSTPSGYISGSNSQLNDIEKTTSISELNKNFSSLDNSPLLTRLHDSPCSKNSNLIEELIEAKLTASTKKEVHSPPNVDVARLEELHKELISQKKVIDEKLMAFSNTEQQTSYIVQENRQSRKRAVYLRLVESLSQSEPHLQNIEQIEELVNLIIVDHSLTGCLLALAYQRAKQENNMRRISSMKPSPKSLLDFIDIDQELYGYENEAAVFQDDNENDVEEEAMIDVSLGDGLVQNDFVGEQQTDSEEGSDIDNEIEISPTIQKKGLRRFFCMPVKSMNPTKKFKPFRRSMKKKNTSLLAAED